MCYNAVAGIERTILSVVNQTYKNIEYIVIDGGSTDGTLEIIEKYRDRIDYFVSEPDNGIYDAMNKGIKVATGEWINFMNAGDEFVSLSTIGELINEICDAKIIYGNILRKYRHLRVRSRGITKAHPSPVDFMGSTIHHQAAFIDIKLFDQYGLYSTEFKLISDWKFFYECVIQHKEAIKYVNMDIAVFNTNGRSSKGILEYSFEKECYLSRLYGKEILLCLKELQEMRKVPFTNVYLMLLSFYSTLKQRLKLFI